MNKIKTYRNKCDRLIQEIGRKTYDSCIVCGKPMSCLHHYVPKSRSTALRYEWDNLIPLCQGCHFRHHNGDPMIQNTINRVKGAKWLKRLDGKRNTIVPNALSWYKSKLEQLTKANK